MNKLILAFTFFWSSSNLFADNMYDNSGHDQVIARKMSQFMRKDDIEFRAVDQFGVPHSLSDFSKKRKINLVAFDLSCSQKSYSTFINKTSLLINTDLNTSREQIAKIFPKHSILFDELHLISKSIGFKHCGDVFQYDFNKEKLQYIRNIFSKPPKKIEFELIKISSFEKEIIPSIQRSCLKCHVGNSSLNFFSDLNKVKSWRKMMLRTMRLKRMPPGADIYYHQELFNYQLNDLKLLSHWLLNIDHYSNEEFNKISEIYKKFLLNEKEKMIGRSKEAISKMDKIIAYPDVIVPAAGAPFYKYFTTSKPTEEDIYFDKFFVKINSDVGHHMALHFSSKPFPKIKLDGSPLDQFDFMQLYGNNPEPTPASVNGKKVSAYKFVDPNIIHVVRNQGFQRALDNSTYFIPKGSYLNLEIHFNPTGKKETSPIELSILKDNSLKNKPIIRRFSMTPDNDVVIARPNEFKSLVEMTYTLPSDINFVGYGLHMHYRGQSGILYAESLDKKREILMSFPTYQYKNQLSSFFNKPLKIKKGTKIISHIIYNNSDLNLSNPNSTKAVKIGTSILDDENYLPRIYYLEYR